MLRSILSLRNFTMSATDGEIGKVKDFYFDDHTWTLRYLVVETGSWLVGRKVLISTTALHAPDWDSHTFPVNLTKEQIKHSPDIDTEKPVTRQHEMELTNHYSWPWQGGGIGFMTTGMVGGVIAPDVPLDDRIADETRHHESANRSEKHLRSFKQLSGFELRSTDENLGEVHDFLLNDTDWTLPYLIIEAGNWYSGKKIVAPTRFIDNVEWESSSIYFMQSSKWLKGLPEFDYSHMDEEDYIKSFENSYSNNRANS